MSTAIGIRRAPAAVGRPVRTARRGHGHGAWPSLFEAAGGEPTLDEMIAGVWEGLTAQRAVDCPVCGAQMGLVPRGDAPTLSGSCRTCGTTLD